MLKDREVGRVNLSRESNSVENANRDQMDITIPLSPKKSNLIQRLVKHALFAPVFYSILGGVVFFSLVVILSTYVLRLKVETAVVNAQIETMVAPTDGYILNVYVIAGQCVKKGSPLITIENIALERELQLARVQTEESIVITHYYERLLKNERQRLNLYKKIGDTRVISANAIVNMSEQAVINAQKALNRLMVLHKKHYVSDAILESGTALYMSAQEKLNRALARQKLENHALHAVKKGMYFTGTKTEGATRDLSAKLQVAQKRIFLNKSRVLIYENVVKKLTLKAPFDGKVTKILKSVGNTTDSIKPIVFIEKTNGNKNIIAYLTQLEVMHLDASKSVKIYMPSSGKLYQGNIDEINRTDGFVDEVKAQYRWRDFQADRSAMVLISVQKSEQESFDKQSFSGMPAIIYFSKKWHIFG